MDLNRTELQKLCLQTGMDWVTSGAPHLSAKCSRLRIYFQLYTNNDAKPPIGLNEL